MIELLIFLLASFTAGSFFQAGAVAVMANGTARCAAFNLMVSMTILVCIGSYTGYLFGFDDRDRMAQTRLDKATDRVATAEPVPPPAAR